MARLREEVNRWPISPERRARVLAGVGPPLWRAIERREVRTRGELATLVRGLIRRLQEAEGISRTLRRACSFAGYAVAEAIERARRQEQLAVEAEAIEQREREAEERWTALMAPSCPAVTPAVALRRRGTCWSMGKAHREELPRKENEVFCVPAAR